MILDRQKQTEVVEEKKESENEAVVAFLQEKEKYKESSSKISKKGANREEQVSVLTCHISVFNSHCVLGTRNA